MQNQANRLQWAVILVALRLVGVGIFVVVTLCFAALSFIAFHSTSHSYAESASFRVIRGTISSSPSSGPVGTVIATMPMGRYPERRQADRGLNVCVSHWRRNSDDGSPLRVKTTGNYFNSRLALLQARDGGYDDAIMVDAAGKVTEGPGYNIFLARGGRLATPAVTHGILEGVTRDTIIRLYQEATGSAVSERTVDKSELYLADELFYCGSGKEVCAIRSVDGIVLRQEAPGDITKSISESYFAVARGESVMHKDWLTTVY